MNLFSPAPAAFSTRELTLGSARSCRPPRPCLGDLDSGPKGSGQSPEGSCWAFEDGKCYGIFTLEKSPAVVWRSLKAPELIQ